MALCFPLHGAYRATVRLPERRRKYLLARERNQTQSSSVCRLVKQPQQHWRVGHTLHERIFECYIWQLEYLALQQARSSLLNPRLGVRASRQHTPLTGEELRTSSLALASVFLLRLYFPVL